MKNFQKGFVVPLLLVLVALLIIGGGVYLYTQKNQLSSVALNEVATTTAQTGVINPVPAQTQSSITPPVNSTQLKTIYTNNQYSFSIGYQSGVAIKDYSTSGITPQFNPSISFEDYANSSPDTTGMTSTIVDIPIVGIGDSTVGSASGDLTVSRSINAADTVDCTSSTLGQNEGRVSINGIIFIRFNSGSASAGQDENDENYRTLQNGACWDIDLITNSFRGDGSISSDNLLATYSSQIESELDADFQTFKFINSSTSSAQTELISTINPSSTLSQMVVAGDTGVTLGIENLQVLNGPVSVSTITLGVYTGSASTISSDVSSVYIYNNSGVLLSAAHFNSGGTAALRLNSPLIVSSDTQALLTIKADIGSSLVPGNPANFVQLDVSGIQAADLDSGLSIPVSATGGTAGVTIKGE
jgi:hypothetical protein